MGGWARQVFLDNFEAARLEPPPPGGLEDYARSVLNDLSLPPAEVIEPDADWGAYQEAHSHMVAAAEAIVEFASRPRQGRADRRVSRGEGTAKPKPSSTPMSNRSAAIRARYRGSK